MSCPDWTLFARGDDLPPAARAHARRCPPCQRQALRLDPTLVFQHLPQYQASDRDIESMKRAVAAMRRARAIDTTAVTHGRAPHPAPRHGWPAALRAAVVATVVLGASLGFWSPWSRQAIAPANVSPANVSPANVSPAGAARANGRSQPAAPAPATAIRGPLIGNVEGHEVIQMAYDDLDLVVVVDSTLEVAGSDV